VDEARTARRARRRRAVALLATALAAGGLAASQVSGREREVEAQLGPPAPVLVAAADIKRGTRLTPEQLPHLLSVRDVPRRWLPPDVLAAPEQAVGLRASVAIPAGAYVTAAAVEEGAADRGDHADPSTLGRGERAVNVTVAGAEAFSGAAEGGSTRVDVLVTTEGPSGGNGRTYVALEDVQLLGLRQGGGSQRQAGDGAAGDAVATLRVTARQAVYLTAAQNFAKEVRLLARPPGDKRAVGESIVSGGQL
jgi:pilus assembly protein CpaB